MKKKNVIVMKKNMNVSVVKIKKNLVVAEMNVIVITQRKLSI